MPNDNAAQADEFSQEQVRVLANAMWMTIDADAAGMDKEARKEAWQAESANWYKIARRVLRRVRAHGYDVASGS